MEKARKTFPSHTNAELVAELVGTIISGIRVDGLTWRMYIQHCTHGWLAGA